MQSITACVGVVSASLKLMRPGSVLLVACDRAVLPSLKQTSSPDTTTEHIVQRRSLRTEHTQARKRANGNGVQIHREIRQASRNLKNTLRVHSSPSRARYITLSSTSVSVVVDGI
jgi:hypothetical protein